MIIQFKDRKNELKEITRILNSDKFEFLVVYGRRRVGKTELVLKATEKKKKIYYLASEENNLERFYETCLKEEVKIAEVKKDWEVLINFLKDKIDVLIIDEFPNLIKEQPTILSLFQSLIDTNLKKTNLKLILLGSSVSLITSKILSYKSPLYGRRTGSLNLKPVKFFDLKEFFNYSIKELMEIYGFADGIPYYLIKIDKPFWEWLGNELQKEIGFLRDEMLFLTKYEFENSGTYMLVLEAIANNKTKLNDIRNFVKLERTDLSPYLKNLVEVNFIERVVPITENVKSRLGRYYISDNFIRFWFRFIYPNLSALESHTFDVSILKKEYASYLGAVFEKVVKQFLSEKKIFNLTKIGKWWYKENEIDLVALNENTKEIFFCECKWSENVDAEEVLKKLKEKASLVKWENKNRKESYAVFAKSFKKKSENCYDLKDLEKTHFSQ